MRYLPLLLALWCPLFAEAVLEQSGFAAPLANWTAWSPRAEIAPRAYVDTTVSRGEAGSLAVSGNSNAAVFGGWESRALLIQGGQWYRFQAFYRQQGVQHEWLEVLARLDWLDARGRRTGQPEYVWRIASDGEWRRVSHEAPAPQNATAVKVQLYLQNAPRATVWWDELSIRAIDDPGPRKAVVAAVNLRPRRTTSAAESVGKFVDLVEAKVAAPVDVILLPEGITVVGNGKKYADVAETIPGPTTLRLGELARRKNAYIVAGIYEREGHALYNTAVLLDRKGEVAGKYRKVYLPREEIEGGLTAGSDYPVFRTDFGNVGVMICWDIQYPDPARALALRGAELILVPIWGGNETLGKARAIENRVFIASSGYNYPTYVMDPDGELLAVAREDGSAAVASIDLNRRYLDEWLGDMRGRLRKELRLDVAMPRPNE
jgi:predicted amidohydrolase